MLGVLVPLVSCGRRRAQDDDAPPKAALLADTGFRPSQHGFPFENEGGKYPKTPGVFTTSGMVRLFGKEACLGGDTKSCKLTPAANEWMGVVNRAMNIGQCEGMAVSSLAFFKKVNDPATFAPGAASAHQLTHQAVGPLIGYYWAYQMLNPVLATKVKSLRTQTPNSVEDSLIEMMKRGELATIAIRSTHGGHAVTPYAVEDRGNGIHWIRIYDNNWPDKDRYIIIDRNENSWKYELASLNPDVPREPWSGGPESHTIGLVPLSARLAKPECPFCTGSGKKVVVPHGTNAISLTNHEGKRIGRDGDNVVNEIPGAEVVDLNTFIEGATVGEPMYVVPAEADYDITISGQDKKATDHHPDDDHGVAILGNGSAVAVETPKLKTSEHDMLSLHRDGGVKYQTASGVIPPIRLAADGEKSGMSVRLTNMKADPGDHVELRVDHKAGEITVQGGGKRTDSYDLKIKHTHAGAEDHEVEHKGIKFHLGESHTIHSDPSPGAKHEGPPRITRGKYVVKAKPEKEKDKDRDKEREHEHEKGKEGKPATRSPAAPNRHR